MCTKDYLVFSLPYKFSPCAIDMFKFYFCLYQGIQKNSKKTLCFIKYCMKIGHIVKEVVQKTQEYLKSTLLAVKPAPLQPDLLDRIFCRFFLQSEFLKIDLYTLQMLVFYLFCYLGINVIAYLMIVPCDVSYTQFFLQSKIYLSNFSQVLNSFIIFFDL